jgi:multidrug efflux system membrane fusion protein
MLATVFASGGCERPQAAQAAPAQRPAPAVTVATAITRDVPVYLDAIGKTVSTETVSIIPQVGGKIIKAAVDNGAYVNKGELLFQIDPQPFDAALDAARASYDQSVAEAEWAEKDFERTKGLLATNAVSQLEFDQKKSGWDVAKAKIAAAKAAVETAELNRKYCDIVAPIEGRAGVRMVDQGNVVKANEGTMITIQRLNPIYAEFTVTENDLGTVRKHLASRGMEVGNEARMNLKVLVDVPGDSARILTALGGLPSSQPSTQPSATTQPLAASQPREGTLVFLDNAVQPGTGTIKLRASVPNQDHYFWPGQFVNVRLVLTTRKDAVLVPAAAQQIGQQGPFVYVVDADQTAQMHPIVPGQRQDDMIVIEKGVNAGDTVIVTGQMTVTPGGKVSVLSAPAHAVQ